jgi:hypothetical protein
LEDWKIMSAAQTLFEKTAEGAIAPRGHVSEISRDEGREGGKNNVRSMAFIDFRKLHEAIQGDTLKLSRVMF